MNSYHKTSGRPSRAGTAPTLTLQRFYVDDEAEPMLELYPCFVDVVDGGDDETVLTTVCISVRCAIARLTGRCPRRLRASRREEGAGGRRTTSRDVHRGPRAGLSTYSTVK